MRRSEGTPAGPWWSAPGTSQWPWSCAGSGGWHGLEGLAQIKNTHFLQAGGGSSRVSMPMLRLLGVIQKLCGSQSLWRDCLQKWGPRPPSPPLQNHLQCFLFHFFILINAPLSLSPGLLSQLSRLNLNKSSYGCHLSFSVPPNLSTTIMPLSSITALVLLINSLCVTWPLASQSIGF